MWTKFKTQKLHNNEFNCTFKCLKNPKTSIHTRIADNAFYDATVTIFPIA